MESQLARPHGHVYEEEPVVEVKPIGLHSVVEGDQEELGGGQHEKKSVMKKVKAKARKLKDTITKHGHSHDEHHIPDDHDLDEEEDDEDEEMIEDPEIHGAPIYDSGTATAAGFAHSVPTKAPGDREQLFDPRREENISGGRLGNREHQLRHDYEGGGPTPMNTPLTTAAVPRTTQLSDDPTRVFVRGHDSAPKVNLTRPHGLEEDPEGPTSRSRPPPNYETKVTGPTYSGGNEAKIDPLSSSFGEMKLGDKGEAKTRRLTGSHDQFSPELPSKEAGDSPLGESSPGSYTEKITSATAAVADKAKNLVASKLGYGTTEGERLHQVGGGDAGTGPTGVSVREYWVEKLRPGEEDKALSEVISSALHTGKNKDTSRRAVVTESEEVRRYLGETGKDDEGQLSGPGKYVVESLKGTVGSWFGKPGESNQEPHHGGEEHVGERRLQESSQ